MTGQEQRIKISELPTSVSFSGLWTLGYQIVDGKKTSVKVSLDEIEKAYEDAVAAASAAGKAAINALSAAARADSAAGKAERKNFVKRMRFNESPTKTPESPKKTNGTQPNLSG